MLEIIKDRGLKLELVNYCISNRWYPQMEVEVMLKEGTSPTKKLVTDIDVLALYPDSFGMLKKLLGDCKTLKGQSPINRTLWLKGLMQLVKADKGIIILQKKIEGDHKLTSNELNVMLMSDKDFKVFAHNTVRFENDVQSALGMGENWDTYFSISNRCPQLKELLLYLYRGFWNEEKAELKLRHMIANLRVVKSEFNPDNNLHIATLLDSMSMFAIALNEVVNNIFSQYLLSDDKKELEQQVKVIVWGGLENYEYWNSLRNIITNTSDEQKPLVLPEWEKFIQLVRSCLDAPYALNMAPLILKEVGFEFLMDKELISKVNYSQILARENKQAARFAIIIVEYISKVMKLPPEFIQIIVGRLMKIQRD